jgi:hypothetical protein
VKAKYRRLSVLLILVLLVSACLPALAEKAEEEHAPDIDLIMALDAAGGLAGPDGKPLRVHKAPSLEGRGNRSKGDPEPNYVGVLGYMALQNGWEVTRFSTFTQTPWELPWYEQVGEDEWKISGIIAHKTPVLVADQKTYEGIGYGLRGYLKVCRLDTFEVGWIDVQQFVTVAYWKLPLEEAYHYGSCIAVYRERSRFLPLDRVGRRGPLPDGIRVLVCDWKSSTRYPSKDKTNNPIMGILFRSSQASDSYYRTFLRFNPEDLTLIY